VSPVKYELGFYIPEDTILYSHRRENLKPYIFFLSSSKLMLKKTWPSARRGLVPKDVQKHDFQAGTWPASGVRTSFTARSHYSSLHHPV
jgi:hypothetical protein